MKPDLRAKIKDRRFRKRAAIVVASLALLYSLLGFLILPWILRPIIEEKASAALSRPVVLEKLSINPFVLSATLRGLAVKDADGQDFVRVGEIYANLQAWSLPTLSVVLKKVSLDQPALRVVRNADGSFNFSDILEALGPGEEAGAQPASPDERPFPLTVTLLDVRDASLLVEDRVKNIRHEVKEASFTVRKFSTLPRHRERDVLFALDLLTNDTRVAVKAISHPFDEGRDATLDLKVTGLHLPRYMAYAPLPPDVFLDSARLDLESEIDFSTDSRGQHLTLSGRVILSDLRLREGEDQPLASVKKTVVSLAPTRLFARDLHVAEVRIEAPELHVRRDGQGKTNLEKILAAVNEKPAAEETEPPAPEEAAGGQQENAPPPLQFVVDKIMLESGRVYFADQSTAPSFATALTPVSLLVENLSNRPDERAGFTLAMGSAKGEDIRAEGKLCLAPLDASGSASVSGLHFRDYFPYYSALLIAEPPDGAVSLSTDFTANLANLAPGRLPDVAFRNLSVQVDGLALREKGQKESVLSVPAFSLLVGRADLPRQEVRISELKTSRGDIRLALEKDGAISLMSLVALPEAAPASASAAAPGAAAATPWTLDVDSLRVEGYRIDFTDKTPSRPARLLLSELGVSASDLSTRPDKEGKLDFSVLVGKTGRVRAEGGVKLNPVAAGLDVSVKGLDLANAEPYFQDKIQVMVTKGQVETKGRLEVAMAPGEAPRVSYQGDAAVLGFASADKKTGEDFLNFASLQFAKLRASTEPMSVSVDGIGLDDFYSRIIIYPDGTVNLKNILPARPEEEKAAQKAAEAPKEPLPVKIAVRQVTLSKGRFNFTDNFIKPNYTANYRDMSGSITGLSSEEKTAAKVDLSGQLGSHAPVTVSGELNPLLPDLYADIQVKVSDMELPALSPYSGRFIGRLIEKGKLSVTLGYKVKDNKLAGENRIYLDQFTLGEKVESEEATSLPVGLAISLLKDRNGLIDLDFAVSGDLNDPEFSVARIVFKVLGNLITKIVTSPFSLLGSVFGGGEDLQYADFTAGSAALSPEAAKKLDALEEALYQRPGLTLDMRGDADPEKDSEALREIHFRNLLKRQMMGTAEADAKSLSEVSIPPDKYAEVLARAFEASEIPRPLDEEGKPRPVSPEETESLLRSSIPVPDDELRILAHQRALAAKEYILEKGRVEAGRAFILEPEPMSKKDDRQARVIFSIR